MRIVVLPGDGIGPEISAATYSVLRAASERFQLNVQTEEHAVGHASLEQFGTTVRPGLLEIVKAADALILGPAATFDFKDEQSGEINPSKFFRKNLDLFANVRPARTYPGLRNRLGDFDLVVVRENTEGFYSDRNMEQGNGEIARHPGRRYLAPPYHPALLRENCKGGLSACDAPAQAPYHRSQGQCAQNR